MVGSMTKVDRIHMERVIGSAMKRLTKDPGFGGAYCSLTPGHPSKVDQASLCELLKSKSLFEPLVNRPDFKAAGVAGDWPFGRGVYKSSDGSLVIWVGAEDHLQIRCTQRTTSLSRVAAKLHAALQMMELENLPFLVDESLGSWHAGKQAAHAERFVTTNPALLGSGVAINVLVPLRTATLGQLKTTFFQPHGLRVDFVSQAVSGSSLSDQLGFHNVSVDRQLGSSFGGLLALMQSGLASTEDPAAAAFTLAAAGTGEHQPVANGWWSAAPEDAVQEGEQQEQQPTGSASDGVADVQAADASQARGYGDVIVETDYPVDNVHMHGVEAIRGTAELQPFDDLFAAAAEEDWSSDDSDDVVDAAAGGGRPRAHETATAAPIAGAHHVATATPKLGGRSNMPPRPQEVRGLGHGGHSPPPTTTTTTTITTALTLTHSRTPRPCTEGPPAPSMLVFGCSSAAAAAAWGVLRVQATPLCFEFPGTSKCSFVRSCCLHVA